MDKIITAEDERFVVEKYREGKTGSQIIELLGNKVKTTKTVYDILRKWEVPRKQGPSSYNPINHGYFSKIDTREKAYLLGLLLADGWVHPPRHQIGLSLIEEDIWALELLKKETNSAANLVHIPAKEGQVILGRVVDKQPFCQLIMSSERMVQDLSRLGVYERKSCREVLPIVGPALQHHVLRGNLDGDGSVFLHSDGKSTCLCFLGGGHLTAQISLYLHLFLQTTYSFPTPQGAQNLFQVRWFQDRDCRKIAQFLYQDSEGLRIRRKYEKVRNLLD